MPTVKKLPKWAIKQAGGINKKAWVLARRGKGKQRRQARKATKKARKSPSRTPRAVGGASRNNNKKGYGAWFKVGRTVDIFSGPAQGSAQGLGFTPEAGMDAGRRYLGPAMGGDIDNVKATAGGIGTGLVRDWFRSKIGVYRGLGRKKILSGVMAANPEILAYAEQSPVVNLEGWNTSRMQFDRGYNARDHRWDVNPTAGEGSRFWKSVGLDVGLKVTQKVAEIFINPLLPTGYNL